MMSYRLFGVKKGIDSTEIQRNISVGRRIHHFS